jgi:hypothetical protein
MFLKLLRNVLIFYLIVFIFFNGFFILKIQVTFAL